MEKIVGESREKCTISSKKYMIKVMKNISLSVGELNPGLPRDRRGYLPLY
jgi:hypothetical protein